MGNAGNITAYWKGYSAIGESPHMWGFQAAGAAPLVHGEIVDQPETVASAISIGNPASWDGAILARNESGGRIEAVTDEEILAAYKLAASEGVFCEPASAASIAGLLKYADELPDGIVVCTLTGHGLKDPDTAIAGVDGMDPIAATLESVAHYVGL